jgi:hypothetical protein
MDTPFVPKSTPSRVKCPGVNPRAPVDVSRSNAERRKENIMKTTSIATLVIAAAWIVTANVGAFASGIDGGTPGFDLSPDVISLATAKGSLPEHAKTAIIEYLELSDAQIDAWDALIDDTAALAGQLRDRVREINDDLEVLFASGDPPADVVGELVIERHDLLEELLRIHRDYVDQFEHGILTEDQHRKYHLVRAAARVERLIPAFRLFALIPPR